MAATVQPRSTKHRYGLALQVHPFDNTGVLRLFSNDIAITPATVLADLIECTFTGYSSFPIGEGWALGFEITNQLVLVSKDVAQFLQTGTTISEIAYGWYFTDDPATTLILSGRFDDPLSFDTTGNQVLIKPKVDLEAISDADSEYFLGP